MDLLGEILVKALKNESLQIAFPNINVERIVELECYKALQAIKHIIDDDSLNDAECFEKIEAIVQTFENLGSDGGFRHDFG